MFTVRLMRQLELLFTLYNVLAWLFVCLLTGCENSPPSPPAREKVFDAYKVPPTNSSVSKDTSRPPISLYIDDSESMKGFVSNQDFTYVRVLRQFFNKSTTAQYKLNIYKFSKYSPEISNKINQQNNIDCDQLTYPEFYNSVDTPLTTLMNEIAKGAKDKTRLYVVISDLVLSEKGKDWLSLVKAFQAVFTSKPELLLISIRSNFYGDYFIEKDREKNHYKLQCPDNNKKLLGRPFYLLIIAPSCETLRQFRRYVLDGLVDGLEADKNYEIFQPTGISFVVNEVKFVQPESASQPLWNRYGDLELIPSLSNSSIPTRLVYKFVERKIPNGSPLKLRMGIKSSIPEVLPTNFIYKIERITWRKGIIDQSLPTHISEWQPKAEREKENGYITLTYPFPRPDSYTWDVYRIQMSSEEGSLSVPPWVHKWSTEDDRSERDGDRTLYLNLLIEAMVRAITENVVFLDQFIMLGRSD